MAQIYCSATGCTGIISVQTEASYSTITASATIECDSTTLSLSDAVTINMGYVGDYGTVFDGYVKRIERSRPDNVYRITCNDILVRATDYFLASDDPENPLTFHDTDDYDLVNGLLAEAGLPNVVSSPPSPSFTFGTNEDGARFNLQSVGEALQFVSSITGRVIYAQGGDIYYVQRYPYIVGGDTPIATWTTGASGNIINISREISNQNIRNRIVVYGKSPIRAEASAYSPYVVVDQTSVIAHELIDTDSLASATASVNLGILNRLGNSYTIDLEGDWTIFARSIYHITESFCNADEDVFVYRVAHTLNSGTGFTTSVTCVT